MAKLSLKQIDSLIDSDEITESELKEFMKDGYDTKDIEKYFIEKIRENNDEDDDDGEESSELY